MRRVAFIILLFVAGSLSAQKEIKVKKKYFGTYAGTVPSYQMDIGNEAVEVGETPISITINKNEILVNIGSNQLKGTYMVMFESKKKYYLIDATMDGQLATERIMLYHRGKRIKRDGMFPQPVTELKKVRKKEF
jgi:hypothetical protein